MGKTVGTIVNVQTKAAERFRQDEEERGKNGCELEEKRRADARAVEVAIAYDDSVYYQ